MVFLKIAYLVLSQFVARAPTVDQHQRRSASVFSYELVVNLGAVRSRKRGHRLSPEF